MSIIIETHSKAETQKVAAMLAAEITKNPFSKTIVLALRGELGAGKTTFSQGFALALGVKEKITSPTFIIFKTYKLKNFKLKNFVHIDCYRLNSLQELEDIGFKKTLQDKNTIILIEWADKVKKLIPKNAIWIKFEHGKKTTERAIKIKNQNANVKM